MAIREARPLKTNPDDYIHGGRLPDNPTAAELEAFAEANDRAMAHQRANAAYYAAWPAEQARRDAEAAKRGMTPEQYYELVVRGDERLQYALAHMYDDAETMRQYEAEQARKTAAAAASAGTARADELRAELDRQQAMADALCRKQASQVEWEVKSVPVPFESVKFIPDGEGRFTGYASTFGPPPDLTNDIVDRDAFSASIRAARARGQRVLYPLLFSHDPQLPIGGIVEAREDGKGLKVEGVIDTDVQAGRDAYSVLKKGFISGLSIGYRVERADHDWEGTRHLKAINLLEVSLVVFPANPAAGVSSLS